MANKKHVMHIRVCEITTKDRLQDNGACAYVPKEWMGKKVRVTALVSSILLMMVMIVDSGIMINGQQIASAASWSSEIESWLNNDAATWSQMCMLNLNTYSEMAQFNDQQLINISNQLLYDCDNNLLIINKDVCPSHDDGFKVCGEPMVYQYLSERGLLSAKAPMEWMIRSDEEMAAAEALVRDAINSLQ